MSSDDDFQTLLDRVLRTNPEIESVLHAISHELRNPLMALLTAAETLEDCVDEDEREAATAVIQRQAAKLATTIESLVDDDHRGAEASDQSANLRDEANSALKGAVLLVEDQEDNREMLALALRREGFTIVTAADVAEALDALESDSFVAAIVDIGLPDGSGHDVALAARNALGNSIKLIALTGHGRETHRGEILESGFDLHLVKPVPLAALKKTLTTAVEVDLDGEEVKARPIRIVAFGPEILVASGIECFVANRDAFELTGTANNRDAAKVVLESCAADVGLVYAAPSDGFGPDFIRTMSVTNRGMGICVIVEGGENSLARECMIAGADACLATSSEPDLLLKAVRVAHADGTFVAPEVDAMVGRDQVFTELTRREREVLTLVADGSTSREISADLQITYKTVDAHRQNIVRKLGSRSIADLVKHALRAGLTDLAVSPRRAALRPSALRSPAKRPPAKVT